MVTALLLACAAPGPGVLSAEEIGVVTQPDTITGRDGGGTCRLARAPVADAQVPEAWTYWDGGSWSPASDDAVVLFDGAPIMSLGWNDYLDAWLVVYSPPFAGQVKARTAPELTGPWSRESVLFDVPEGDAPYDANHHPELAEQDGKVQYITWSRHTTGWFGSEFALLRVDLQ